MFKKFTLVVAAALSMASAANAATITLNKGLNPGFTVQNSSGTAIQSFVFVGTFAGGTNPSAGTEITQVVSSFNVFGTAVSIASGATISGSVDYSGVVDDEVFENLKIFILVSNSADLATATQVGIFGNTPPTAFPADVAAGGSNNFNVNTFGNLEAISGFGGKIDNASGADVITLVPVPEPSAALLGALGMVALIRRRR